MNEQASQEAEITEEQFRAVDNHLAWAMKILGHPFEAFDGLGEVRLTFDIEVENGLLQLAAWEIPSVEPIPQTPSVDDPAR